MRTWPNVQASLQRFAGLEHMHAVAGNARCPPVEAVIGVAHRLDADIGIIPGIVDLKLAQGAVGRDRDAPAIGMSEFDRPSPALIASVEHDR